MRSIASLSLHELREFWVRDAGGAAQPDRKRTRQQGGISGIQTHFAPINARTAAGAEHASRKTPSGGLERSQRRAGLGARAGTGPFACG